MKRVELLPATLAVWALLLCCACAPAQGEGKKKKRSRKRRSSGQKKAAQPAEEGSAVRQIEARQSQGQQGRLLKPEKKRRRRSAPTPPPMMRSPYAHQKDSTEQKSLMKPYYITKD